MVGVSPKNPKPVHVRPIFAKRDPSKLAKEIKTRISPRMAQQLAIIRAWISPMGCKITQAEAIRCCIAITAQVVAGEVSIPGHSRAIRPGIRRKRAPRGQPRLGPEDFD
jgi:hypothetical protein